MAHPRHARSYRHHLSGLLMFRWQSLLSHCALGGVLLIVGMAALNFQEKAPILNGEGYDASLFWPLLSLTMMVASASSVFLLWRRVRRARALWTTLPLTPFGFLVRDARGWHLRALTCAAAGPMAVAMHLSLADAPPMTMLAGALLALECYVLAWVSGIIGLIFVQSIQACIAAAGLLVISGIFEAVQLIMWFKRQFSTEALEDLELTEAFLESFPIIQAFPGMIVEGSRNSTTYSFLEHTVSLALWEGFVEPIQSLTGGIAFGGPVLFDEAGGLALADAASALPVFLLRLALAGFVAWGFAALTWRDLLDQITWRDLLDQITWRDLLDQITIEHSRTHSHKNTYPRKRRWVWQVLTAAFVLMFMLHPSGVTQLMDDSNGLVSFKPRVYEYSFFFVSGAMVLLGALVAVLIICVSFLERNLKGIADWLCGLHAIKASYRLVDAVVAFLKLSVLRVHYWFSHRDALQPRIRRYFPLHRTEASMHRAATYSRYGTEHGHAVAWKWGFVVSLLPMTVLWAANRIDMFVLWGVAVLFIAGMALNTERSARKGECLSFKDWREQLRSTRQPKFFSSSGQNNDDMEAAWEEFVPISLRQRLRLGIEARIGLSLSVPFALYTLIRLCLVETLDFYFIDSFDILLAVLFVLFVLLFLGSLFGFAGVARFMRLPSSDPALVVFRRYSSYLPNAKKTLAMTFFCFFVGGFLSNAIELKPETGNYNSLFIYLPAAWFGVSWGFVGVVTLFTALFLFISMYTLTRISGHRYDFALGTAEPYMFIPGVSDKVFGITNKAPNARE